MTSRPAPGTLRVRLAEALQRVTAWRVGLGGLGVDLDRPGAVPASEIRERYADCVRRLKAWRNELDALIAALDEDDRPTPIHPYALPSAACETCPHCPARIAHGAGPG